MANRYWRGGSGSWTSFNTANWSATSGGAGGASVPTAADSVFFTLGSTYTVTLATACVCLDFTVSAGVVTFANSANPIPTLTVYGNFSILANTVNSGVVSGPSQATLNFFNTGGKTVDAKNVSLGFNVNIGSSSYPNTSITLLSTFRTTSIFSATITLAYGTLNLNDFDLTTAYFSSDNSNTRALAFGSGNINTIGVSCGNVTNMTLTKTTGAFTGPGGTNSYTWGSSGNYTIGTTEAPNLTFTGAGSGAGLVNFGQDSTFGRNYWDTINFGSTAARVQVSTVNTYNYPIICRNLILNSSVNLTTYAVKFSQYGTGTFTSNGCTLVGLSLVYTSSNLTLGDSLTFQTTSYSSILSHERGTLNLNGFNLNLKNYTSSSSTNARTIDWNGGSMYFSGDGSISVTSGTGLTVLNGPGNIFATMYTSLIRSINWCSASGGSLSIAPNLTLTGTGTATSQINTIAGGSWFNNLDCSEPICAYDTVNSINVGGNVVLSSDATSVFSNSSTFNFYGSACTLNTNGKGIYGLAIGSSTYQDASLTLLSTVSSNSGVSCAFPYGTLNLNDYNLYVGIFDSGGVYTAGTRQINFGSGYITLTYSATATYPTESVLRMQNATGFTWTGTGGFSAAMSTIKTFKFGTVAGGSASNAPNLSLISGASIPTITTGGWFNILDFTGSTCTPAVTSLNLNGLVLASGGTYTNLTPIMRGTGTITTNAKTLPNITIDSSGTTTLGGALTTTGATTITAGTLNLAGFTLQTPNVTSSSSSSRSITGTGNITVTGDWTISNGTNFTGSNYNINMNNASAKTFAGGNGSYGKLIQAGAGVLTISGSNTFADITATTRPSTITFTAGTTQIVTYLTLSGTTGNLVTINSSTAGTRFNLSKIGGAVNASYLNIQDSNATGGATWKAYNGTNTDSGNNSGWAFVYVAPLITGEFMAFF